MNKYEIKCVSTYGWDKGEKYTDEYKANSLVEAWEEWKRKHSPGWGNYNIGGIYKEDDKGSTTSFLVLYGSSHDVDSKIKSGKYVNDSKVKDKMGIANLQFLASPNKIDLSKKDTTGEISIICKNEDEKEKVKRLLYKNRVPIDYEEGNKIIVLSERVQDSKPKDSKVKDEDLSNKTVVLGPLFMDKPKNAEWLKKAKSIGLKITERMGQSKYYFIEGKASDIARVTGDSIDSLYKYSQQHMSIVEFYDSQRLTKDEIKNLHKLADAFKVKDYFDIKPGVIFKQRESFSKKISNDADAYYLKVLKIEGDNITFTAYKRKDGKNLESVGTENVPLAHFKRLLEGGYAQVNSFYDSKVKDDFYSESDKKNKEFVKNALSEMKKYERNWNGMSSQDRKNVGCTLSELKKRIAELEKVKDDSKAKDSLKSFKVNGKIVKATDEFHAIRQYKDMADMPKI